MERWQVTSPRDVAYELVKCTNLFDPLNPTLLSCGRQKGSRRIVIVDRNVYDLHSAALEGYFARNEVQARILAVPGGEDNKSVDAYLALLCAIDEFPVDRRDEPIVAIGGGVITDLAGFAAGTYRRGLPCVRVPTTLIGYVDAAVGVKTGVNLGDHKNRIGVFAPPAKVLLDRSFLRTLPRRHILNGVCEIFKLAVICDFGLFEHLESHGAASIEGHFQDDAASALLDHAIQATLGELRLNLFEDNLARTLDFGHTFAYGLETFCGSQYLHGEAVLIDVLISSHLARARGLLSGRELARIVDLAWDLHLIPETGPLNTEALWDSLCERTLHRNGRQRIPLPDGIGKCTFVDDVAPSELMQAGSLHQIRDRA